MAIIPTSNIAPDGFETLAQARDRRAYKIAVLRGGNGQQQQLAAKLKRCRKGNRCNSGACDVCVRFFRLRLLRQLQPILESRPHWTRASVVTDDLLFAEGALANVDLNALKRKISKRTRAVELAGSYRRRWHRHFAQHRKQRDRRLAVAPLHVYRRRADNKTGRGGQSDIPARENSPGTLQLDPTNRQSEAGHLSLQIDILASLAVHRLRATPKNEKPTFETSRAERAARIFGQIPSRRSPDPPWPPPRRQEFDRYPERTGPNQITPVGAENRRSIGGLPMCRRHLSRTRRITTCQ